MTLRFSLNFEDATLTPMRIRSRGGGIATEGSFYKAWNQACERAGLAGRQVLDLRRTVARDMRRAGVSEGEMTL
jgi:integrase